MCGSTIRDLLSLPTRFLAAFQDHGYTWSQGQLGEEAENCKQEPMPSVGCLEKSP